MLLGEAVDRTVVVELVLDRWDVAAGPCRRRWLNQSTFQGGQLDVVVPPPDPGRFTITSCRRTADNHPVSTDAQTQAIPRVPAAAIRRVWAAVIAAPDAETAAPAPAPAAPAPDTKTATSAPDTEIAAPQPAGENAAAASDAEVAGEEPVQQVYEAAMARLNALHDSWAAAMVGLRDAQIDSGPGKAAA